MARGIYIPKQAALFACAAVAVGGWVQTGNADELVDVSIFMSDLVNPKGLSFNGETLFVAESGIGGDLLVGQGQAGDVFYGTSGRISSKALGGSQQVHLEGLPSLAGAAGANAAGPADIAFGPDGLLYGVIGLGNDPALRSDGPLATQALGSWLGGMIRQNPDSSVERILDLSGYEAAFNPDGGVIDSNPFSFAFVPGGDGQFAVTDAGGNSLLIADLNGIGGQTIVFPDQPNPLPFGPPNYQAVPTGVTFSADGGTLYVSQLTGFPFPEGAANVYAMSDTSGTEFFGSDPVVLAGGLTNLVDLTVGGDGNLYALSIDTNGLAAEGGTGGLYRINLDGSTDLVLSEGLIAPTGLTSGPDGALYISNMGTSPDAGEVLRVVVVPEPTSGFLVLAGAGLALLRRRRA